MVRLAELLNDDTMISAHAAKVPRYGLTPAPDQFPNSAQSRFSARRLRNSRNAAESGAVTDGSPGIRLVKSVV
jgi:hypothetical protein